MDTTAPVVGPVLDPGATITPCTTSSRRSNGSGAAARGVVGAVLCLLLVACSGSDGSTSPSTGETTGAGGTADGGDRPLRVLLSNDDGWDAPGIVAVRTAMLAAGWEVWEVAPLENQSGASMVTTQDPLRVTRPLGDDVDVWAVDGSPVDAVTLGLRGVLLDDPPDVVVSGVNSGANVGLNINYSGTVGVALAARELGVPAVAVSADAGPDGTIDADGAASLTVDLVRGLVAAGWPGLGTDRVLNVNVPSSGAAGAGAPELLAVAPAAPREKTYTRSSPGVWSPAETYDTAAGPAGDDVERLADGVVTTSVLTLDRSVTAGRDDGSAATRALRGALAEVASP